MQEGGGAEEALLGDLPLIGPVRQVGVRLARVDALSAAAGKIRRLLRAR